MDYPAISFDSDVESPLRGQDILVPVSIGELIDKITILEIKAERFAGQQKINVDLELKLLTAIFSCKGSGVEDSLINGLRDVNRQLWEIEDEIRSHERRQEFGSSFIQLARSVYQLNDQRSGLKKEINVKSGSGIVEEKVYSDY